MISSLPPERSVRERTSGRSLEHGIDSTASHFNTTDTVLDVIVVHTLNANDYAPWDMGPFVM